MNTTIFQVIEQTCSSNWVGQFHKNCITETYTKGNRVFSVNTVANFIQFICSGNVKVVHHFSDSERIVRLANDGSILGHRGIGGDKTYSVSAYALTEVTLKQLPSHIFDLMLKENADFCYEMLHFFADELRKAESLFKIMTTLPVKNRVAQALLMNMDAFGVDTKTNELNYTLSRKDISNIASTTYESVIRALSELEKEQVIESNSKSIKIIKPKVLENMVKY